MTAPRGGPGDARPSIPELPALEGPPQLVRLARGVREEMLVGMRDVLRWMASARPKSERPDRARASALEAWDRYLELRRETRAWWWLERRDVAPVFVLTGRAG